MVCLPNSNSLIFINRRFLLIKFNPLPDLVHLVSEDDWMCYVDGRIKKSFKNFQLISTVKLKSCMRINLNNPKDFTIENLKIMIASEDDSVHTQFRVTKDGFLFLSRDVGNSNLNDIIFRLETNGAYNGYVGEHAAKDESWVGRVFNVIKENWPKPKSTYCDDF